MTLPTPAGQADPSSSATREQALNALFALFRVNYHNQFYKAYPDTETLNSIKRLWLNSLGHLQPNQIQAAGERLVQQSEFLPTLAQMLQACCVDADGNPLPDARSAYIEACNAPSPKADFDWSHPAVYWAGRATGWHRLASSEESRCFPLFAQQYQKQLHRLMHGDIVPEIKKLAAPEPQTKTSPLDRDAARKKMQAIRDSLQD